ncbi:MAG: histone deacetylase [Chloroflexi bacterium]|nr:histone deacetylase [Chloroflexota bacterium]
MTTAYVTHPRYVEHHLAGHPEHAGRIRAIWQELDTAGLSARMKRIEPFPVAEDLIANVHSRAYMDTLRQIERLSQPVMHLNADTYITPNGYTLARLAAGGVVRAVDEVLSGRANNALAAVRPPGHHAMPAYSMGFCILGNVPIAACYALQEYDIGRILIVDFDVHHGNGTEAMFYDDDRVLFISTHQYPFYPGTGAVNDIGQDKGKGFTINIPLPPGHGDKNYAALFERVVWPAAHRFQPELIIVSAGFDAHWADPLAGIRLSLTGYSHLTHELIRMAEQLCGGKIVFALEGGYNLTALAHGVRNIAHALLGDDEVSDPIGLPRDTSPEPDISPLLHILQTLHGL